MIDVTTLPMTMTALEIRTQLRKCTSETLRLAFLRGDIEGVQISRNRILYHTSSVLKWLGLLKEDQSNAFAEATESPPEPFVRADKVKTAKRTKRSSGMN
jgi:hypothetical protein